MLLRVFAFAMLFGMMANFVDAAGLKTFEVPADAGGPSLRVAEWTPCATPSGQVQLGPFSLPAIRNCPIAGDKLGLIVVSHGFGGTYLGHHDTAEALADAGFIVVALNHPDDTASNEAKARNLTALISRPMDIRRLIDFMLGPSADAGKIDPRRIGFFGFSRGGYTGLVLAGANPDFHELRSQCQDVTGATCRRIDETALPTLGPSRDPRIAAFVIADPLSNVFSAPESLKDVKAPIQLWASQHGGDGVSPENVAAIARNLPGKPDLNIVPNASHFAFLTVCPDALAKTAPEICNDGAGFDRAAFHRDFDARTLAFFQQNLASATQP